MRLENPQEYLALTLQTSGMVYYFSKFIRKIYKHT